MWGVGGGRVQGDQRSASLPGHAQCGNRWGALWACLSSAPAWARAWGQMTRWSDGQEVGVFRPIPGCQAWGRSFRAALVLPDHSSNQYLCKCSQLGKMQSARRPDPGEGQSWPAEGAAWWPHSRERRGWVPGAGREPFISCRISCLCCMPSPPPLAPACVCDSHTPRPPDPALTPFLTKTSPGTGAIQSSPGLPGMPVCRVRPPGARLPPLTGQAQGKMTAEPGSG